MFQSACRHSEEREAHCASVGIGFPCCNAGGLECKRKGCCQMLPDVTRGSKHHNRLTSGSGGLIRTRATWWTQIFPMAHGRCPQFHPVNHPPSSRTSPSLLPATTRGARGFGRECRFEVAFRSAWSVRWSDDRILQKDSSDGEASQRHGLVGAGLGQIHQAESSEKREAWAAT